MKAFFLISGLAILSLPAFAGSIPTAKPTDNPGLVFSPYSKGKKIDIRGLEPGCLAHDPYTKQVFRVPLVDAAAHGGKPSGHVSEASQPGATPQRVIRRPHLTDEKGAPLPRLEPNLHYPIKPKGESEGEGEKRETGELKVASATKPSPPASSLSPKEIENHLREFVGEYIKAGESDRPDASASFFAPVVLNYFGRRNYTRPDVIKDRQRYLSRFPDREYELVGEPTVLVGSDDLSAQVEARFQYRVANGPQSIRGVAVALFSLTKARSGWQIVEVDERKG